MPKLLWANTGEEECRYTEASVYTFLCGAYSLVTALLSQYKQKLSRNQVYVYTIYELSAHQREFILLTISTIAYIIFTSTVYAWLENWSFNDATYWCIVTFATIGLGDLYPRRFVSKLLPVFASFISSCSEHWSILPRIRFSPMHENVLINQSHPDHGIELGLYCEKMNRKNRKKAMQSGNASLASIFTIQYWTKTLAPCQIFH